MECNDPDHYTTTPAQVGGPNVYTECHLVLAGGQDASKLMPKCLLTFILLPDMLQRLRSSPPLLSGPDLARLMHVGTRVVRGSDWKWGDQVSHDYRVPFFFSCPLPPFPPTMTIVISGRLY